MMRVFEQNRFYLINLLINITIENILNNFFLLSIFTILISTLIGFDQDTFADLHNSEKSKWLIYSDISEFKVNYSPHWQIDVKPDEKFVKFTINDDNRYATASFNIHNTTYPITSEYLRQLITDDLESVGTIEEFKSKDISIQGISGSEFIVTWTGDDNKIKQLFRHLFDGYHLYAFVFTTSSEDFDYYEPIRDELLNSFNISDDANYNWHVDSTNNFKTLYHKNWEKTETNDETKLVKFSSHTGSSITITKLPNSENYTVDKLDKYALAEIAELPFVELVESGETTLGGVVAQDFLFKWDFFSVEMQMRVVATIVDEDVYTIMFMSPIEEYESDLPFARKMINSFEFIVISSTAEKASSLIPKWVKTNVGWWSQDRIDDATFISGIQFLIKDGILEVPPTTETIQESSEEIPSWIKSNAEFWASGLISDNDFLNGIQYLIANGIIQV